jgi:ABC-type nitrate/sulfonate/bicarbonate transport system substrate-binding protein
VAIVAPVVAMSLGLAVASGSAKTTSTTKSTTPTKLAVLPWAAAFGTNNAVTILGLEDGLFASAGLRVNIDQQETGTEVVDQVAAGQIPIGTMGGSVALEARAQGLPIEIIALNDGNAVAKTYSDEVGCVAGPHSGIPANDPGAMSGKSVGVPTGSGPEFYLDAMLKDNGVAVSSVHQVNVAPTNMISALQAGSVDAVCFGEPTETEALEDVAGSVLIHEGSLAGWNDDGVLVANINWAKAHPKELEAFLKVDAQIHQIARKDINAVAVIAPSWVPGVTLAIAKRALRHYQWDPRLSENVVKAYQNVTLPVLVANNPAVPANFNVPGLFNGKYIAVVEKEYPQYFSDLPKLPKNDPALK